MTLPLAAKAGPPAPTAVASRPVPARPPAPISDSLPPMRILVVEDEPLVAMELMMEIEDGGAVAIGPASSCEQALAIIRDERPDLALLDGNLNGEKIDAVADLLAARDTPFAFVSGYDRDHLPAGHAARPMLGKPFVASDVRRMIRQLAAEATAMAR